jgi:hypothetical protein
MVISLVIIMVIMVIINGDMAMVDIQWWSLETTYQTISCPDLWFKFKIF